MTRRLGRLVQRAVTDGRLRPATALGALMVLTKVRARRKLRSVRRLEIENLRYYRDAIRAGGTAAWTSLFAPTELLDALGLAPLCLEGLAGLLAAAGDVVPADARLVSSRDLHVQQAALTGESLPAEKRAPPEPVRQVEPTGDPNQAGPCRCTP